MTSFGKIGPPWWDDQPVAIIGGGPSLAGFDFERLRHSFHVMAVNASIWMLPWADVGFSLDGRLYECWRDRLHLVPYPVYWALHPLAAPRLQTPAANVTLIARLEESGLSHNLAEVPGKTSGFGALNLAYLKRAKDVRLFGFDYQPQGDVWHHNEDLYDDKHQQDCKDWRQWAAEFAVIAPLLRTSGVRVVNASPRSLIDCFDVVTLDQAASP